MNFGFIGSVRLDQEKYAPTRFLPPPVSHSHACPCMLMHRPAGMAFNFSAIDVAESRRLRFAARRALKLQRAEERSRLTEISATESKSTELLNLPGLLPGF